MYPFTMESSARMQAATWAILECESSAVEQRQYKIGFLAQKAQPSLAVGRNPQIGLPIGVLQKPATFRLEL